MDTCHAAQEVVIGIQALGRLMPGPFDFGLFQLGSDRANDTRSYLILQGEYIPEFTFESVRPEMRAGSRIDKLTGDAHLAACFTDAAFQDVAHPELTPDVLHIDESAVVSEAGDPSDDEQLLETGHRGDDLFHHSVGEILLIGITAHVLKR